MYKKSESDISVCYTINRADIRRSCCWYTILASLPGVCFVTVTHFYFGADLISVISVQGFFTLIKSLPKF